MSTERTFEKKKTIALVAHDNKKADLIDWARTNSELLAGHRLVSTGTTGKMLEEETGTKVERVLSGPLGGDQQIGAMIAEGKIDIIIFFWDPMSAQPHDSDVKALLRIAVAWNVIMACNRTTADFILQSPLMDQVQKVQVPDYSSHLNRKLR